MPMRTCLIVTFVLGLLPPVHATEKDHEIFFETKVRPLLIEHCVTCHGPKKQQAGLRLDTATGFKKGTDEGPIFSAENPKTSLFLQSIQRSGDYPMPPTKPLPKEALAVLTEWAMLGAPYPETRMAEAPKVDPQSHWAFQPVRDPAVPQTISPAVNPIDRFLLAKLEAQGGSFATPTDRRTLIRRAYYDLVGLPPSYDEVQRFVLDTDPHAFEKLVDRLLASPHYGERWGRFWLDIARYADSKGYVFTEEPRYPYAYTYRDYVIRSFNEDKPYNRFLLEQLAADRLQLGEDKRPLAAMGFLTLGRRFSNNTHDIIDDRIDVVTRGLLGLTVGCARCHDHKYDPVSIGDYYSLYGVFAGSHEPGELPLIGKEDAGPEQLQFQADLAKMLQEVEKNRVRLTAHRVTGLSGLASGLGIRAEKFPRILNRADRNVLTKLQKAADQFRAKSPFAPPRAMVLQENDRPTQPVIFLRGNPNNRGPRVDRHYPPLGSPTPAKPFTIGSGRLELAQAISDPKNPLTARVLVNRVWGRHFGQHLVTTPSDFGLRSDPPSHPELLDWLATRFVEDGWSIKKLHRRMMLTQAYQQSSKAKPDWVTRDPENRLLSHANRQRLDWEALRDSLLVVSGQLDRKLFGRSVDLFARPFTKRRTVYAYIDRQNLPGTLSVFDFANPDAHTPQRFRTTVPQQALFLLNSPFMAEQVRAVIQRPEVKNAGTNNDRVRMLYELILTREPTRAEVDQATRFVESVKPHEKTEFNGWELFAQVLMMSNEFAFVD